MDFLPLSCPFVWRSIKRPLRQVLLLSEALICQSYSAEAAQVAFVDAMNVQKIFNCQVFVLNDI